MEEVARALPNIPIWFPIALLCMLSMAIGFVIGVISMGDYSDGSGRKTGNPGHR